MAEENKLGDVLVELIIQVMSGKALKIEADYINKHITVYSMGTNDRIRIDIKNK